MMKKPSLEYITKKEVLIKTAAITLATLLAFFSNDIGKQYINIVGFLLAFVLTVCYRKHFFPFVSAAIFLYLAATAQELWNEKYMYQPITKFYWTMGNICLFLGIANFAYRLKYKYKIVDND